MFGEVLPVNKQFTSTIDVKNEVRREQMNLDICNQDDLQLDYQGTLDGVLDFVYRDIILEELKNGRDIDFTNYHLMAKLKCHFRKYSQAFLPIIFLDNHDVDRIMHVCNGDRSLVDKLLVFTQNLGVPYSVYYGTEQYMYNKSSLSSGEPYADLEVRTPMDWR